MELLLVRHGVTQHNADRIFMGWDPVPLAPEGRRQIERLAERLRGERISRIVASDIQRVVESAEILSAAIGLPYEKVEALREVNVGRACGLSYDEAARRWPGLLERSGGVCFPEGESFLDVAERSAAYVLASVIRESDDRVLVVTHGGVVVGLAAKLLGRPLADFDAFAVDNASLSTLRVENGKVALVSWSDTGHLTTPAA